MYRVTECTIMVYGRAGIDDIRFPHPGIDIYHGAGCNYGSRSEPGMRTDPCARVDYYRHRTARISKRYMLTPSNVIVSDAYNDAFEFSCIRQEIRRSANDRPNPAVRLAGIRVIKNNDCIVTGDQGGIRDHFAMAAGS